MRHQQLRSFRCRIRPDRIHFLKFILEGYDNLAMLSTIDQRTGLVMIRLATEMQEDILSLLEALAGQILPPYPDKAGWLSPSDSQVLEIEP